MTIIGLLIAVFATAVIVWLCNQGKIPSPFHWLAYAVLLIVWFVILLSVVNLGFLSQQLG